MMRYRWFRVSLPLRLEKVIQLLSDTPLVSDTPFGFSRIDDSQSGRLRFWWRTQVVVSHLDEYGEPSFEPIASVSFTDFEFLTLDKHLVLRVENPGRSCRDLLNALETVFGYGFYCKSITFEGAHYPSFFTGIGPANLVGLKVVGSLPNQGLLARVDLASKEGMLEEEIPLLQGMKYRTDQAIFEILFHGTRGKIAITSSGLIRTTGHLAPMLVDLVQQALPGLLERQEE